MVSRERAPQQPDTVPRPRSRHAKRRKGPGPRTIIALVAAGLVVVLGAGAAVWWFVVVPNSRPELSGDEVYGIDVSSHQGAIDWKQVAADNVDFAYIKASEGQDVTDANFTQNWNDSAEAGVRRGAYHFFSLCSSGAEQAVYFLGTAAPIAGALPPAVDLELAGNCAKRPDSATVKAELQAFLATVEKAWQARAVIYVGDDWESRYPVLERLARPRWLQSFFGPPDLRWSVWQVHGFAHVNGVNGNVDLNVGRLKDLDKVTVAPAG